MSSVARDRLPNVFLNNKHLTTGLGLVLLLHANQAIATVDCLFAEAKASSLAQ